MNTDLSALFDRNKILIQTIKRSIEGLKKNGNNVQRKAIFDMSSIISLIEKNYD